MRPLNAGHTPLAREVGAARIRRSVVASGKERTLKPLHHRLAVYGIPGVNRLTLSGISFGHESCWRCPLTD